MASVGADLEAEATVVVTSAIVGSGALGALVVAGI